MTKLTYLIKNTAYKANKGKSVSMCVKLCPITMGWEEKLFNYPKSSRLK